MKGMMGMKGMKGMKDCLVLLICMFGCTIMMRAQTKLSGQIVDKNHHAIPGVSIDFNNGLVKTTSDGDGKFSLSYPDTVSNRCLCLQSFGYKTKRLLLNRGQSFIKVVLTDSIYNLGFVTVSALRNGRFSDYSAQTIQMSTLDIVTNPAAMADIIGNMRVLPGVQTNDNDGRLIIQGGSSDESQIYINDLIVANPYATSSKNGGARSRFTPDLFSGTILQSGGFNAEFGQALSGIVNLNTKEQEQMTAKTDISISSVYAGMTHIDKKPSYAYRASLNYNNRFLTDKVIESENVWKNPYQSIVSDIFLTKELSPDTKITAQWNGSYANGCYSYKNVDGMTLENNLTQSYLYGQLNFYHSFDDAFSLSAASNLIIDHFSGTGLQTEKDKSVTQNGWNHTKITLQYKMRKIINRSGAEFIANPYRETYTSEGIYRKKLQNNLAALYNDTKFFLSNNFTASVGLRGEYSVYLKKTNLAPRVYLAYRLKRESTLSVAAGDYFQLPATDYLKRTDKLDFASVRKITASYGYVEKENKFQFDVYYKKYRHLATYSQERLVDNSGNGYGCGADVFWKNQFKALEYWATYSFNHIRKKYMGFAEAVTPPQVSKHSFNLTLKYWVAPLKSLLAANSYLASGMRYYDNAMKPGMTPLHSRLDLSWSYLPVQWIVIHGGCQNVLGRKNIYGYEYSKIRPDLRKAITAADDRFVFIGVFITLSRSKTANRLKSL
jgi:hypothetical protein